jgi:hypothetical protein
MANCRYCGLTNAIRDNTCIHCGTQFGGVAPEHRGAEIVGQPRTYAEWRRHLRSQDGRGIHRREPEPVGAK